MIQPLDIGEYRNVYEPGKVECASTEEMRPLEELIGQERALRALRFGLEIREIGFNVYAAGAQGTGRVRAVRSFLDELAKAKSRASDWVYVHDFKNQYEPNAIALPAGRGREFQEDIKRFIDEARQALPRAFQSEEYTRRRDGTLQKLQGKRTDLIARINQRAQEAGFVIQMSPIGLLTIPVIDGRPVPDEEFINLPGDVRAEVQRRRDALSTELRSMLLQVQDIDRLGAEAVTTINREIALSAIGNLVAELREKYAGVPEVPGYIDAVQDDILENLQAFLGISEQQDVPPQLQALMREVPVRK